MKEVLEQNYPLLVEILKLTKEFIENGNLKDI